MILMVGIVLTFIAMMVFITTAGQFGWAVIFDHEAVLSWRWLVQLAVGFLLWNTGMGLSVLWAAGRSDVLSGDER